MNSIEQHARKQVLLTRIAFERVEMRRDMAHLRQATRLPTLLRAMLGIGTAKPPSHAGGSDGNGLALALSLWRRYRGTAMLLGSLAPVWRVAKGWRRFVVLAGIGAAAWAGWSALNRRRPP